MVEVNNNANTRGFFKRDEENFRQLWHQGNTEDWGNFKPFVESNTSLRGHGYDAVRSNYEASTWATPEGHSSKLIRKSATSEEGTAKVT